MYMFGNGVFGELPALIEVAINVLSAAQGLGVGFTLSLDQVSSVNEGYTTTAQNKITRCHQVVALRDNSSLESYMHK